MTGPEPPLDKLIWFLRERHKELQCLYRIEEILAHPEIPLDDIFHAVVNAIPPGWQFPDWCAARVQFEDSVYRTDNWAETPWQQRADIHVHGQHLGDLTVGYTRSAPPADEGPFLAEETKLIATIAERLGFFVMFARMKHVLQGVEIASADLSAQRQVAWRVVLDLLRETDRALFRSIALKVLNHLCWSGVKEAEQLRAQLGEGVPADEAGTERDENRPDTGRVLSVVDDATGTRIVELAASHLGDDETLAYLQRLIQNDKLSFLVEAVVNRNHPLPEVADALRRYHQLTPEGARLPESSERSVIVALARRFFTEHLEYLNVAKRYLEVEDFFRLLQGTIFTSASQGKLGGKSAGLFLAAKVLDRAAAEIPALGRIRVPRTWYITSDVLLDFIHYNHLDDVVEQKYKEINQVRLEYSHIIDTFKSCPFPPEIVRGLAQVLDEVGEHPVIVRSSSLLEDHAGSAFPGKYKSLFLANQGAKGERLAALAGAVAEVYASTFGPDPIQYRMERGLSDFQEEMGIMIQEVVGTRIGPYFAPTFAGVGFSRNEFRWSPRIRREDGLLRLVPGLGTRAVDRLADDYPVLVAPGQPGLRTNSTPDEVLHYAPRKLDVLNLETNRFETVRVDALLREYGAAVPGVARMVSLHSAGHVRKPLGTRVDFEREDLVWTFEGLISDTPFLGEMRAVLETLERALGVPVDIEFASDGTDIYLLQCRPQSDTDESRPSPIPQDLPTERVLFTANRFVSNGRVPDLTHLVYVDAAAYTQVQDRADLLAIGRAVGRLNQLLPKRQFALIGPGRWGSRGDIKLGVSVSYSDISHCALLVEVARRRDGYAPDLSFGTHFFQDLVEARIRYLPLYPDDEGAVFNERWLHAADNLLAGILPEYAHLAGVLRVIDVPASSGGLVARVLMNAALDSAVAYLTSPATTSASEEEPSGRGERASEPHWRWRLAMAQRIASELDLERFGVVKVYLIGSTKNATAGPASDIDLLVHHRASTEQIDALRLWLDGWSRALDEMNFLRTGYRSNGLLDVHLVTDDDIARGTSFAVKIGAVTDAARPL